MKNPLNGSTKLVLTIVFSAGILYGAVRIAIADQQEIKRIALNNDTRLTKIETKFDYFTQNQTEIKQDIKTLLRRGN